LKYADKQKTAKTDKPKRRKLYDYIISQNFISNMKKLYILYKTWQNCKTRKSKHTKDFGKIERLYIKYIAQYQAK